MLSLDHIAVLADTLGDATRHVEDALAVPMRPGGRHAHFATHNRLLGLRPDLYLEAIAIDPGAEAPSRPRWFGLDAFSGPPRLDKWILRTRDLDAALSVLPMAGDPVALSRDALRWRMAVPGDGLLPFDGLFPAIIEWQEGTPPGMVLGVEGPRLAALTVTHPEAQALESLLSPHLDAPLVRFEEGPAGLSAEIETAEGRVCLR